MNKWKYLYTYSCEHIIQTSFITPFNDVGKGKPRLIYQSRKQYWRWNTKKKTVNRNKKSDTRPERKHCRSHPFFTLCKSNLDPLFAFKHQNQNSSSPTELHQITHFLQLVRHVDKLSRKRLSCPDLERSSPRPPRSRRPSRVWSRCAAARSERAAANTILRTSFCEGDLTRGQI